MSLSQKKRYVYCGFVSVSQKKRYVYCGFVSVSQQKRYIYCGLVSVGDNRDISGGDQGPESRELWNMESCLPQSMDFKK